MSDGPVRITLVGATGLVGGHVMAQCVGREDVRLSAVARREAALPPGIRMELFVAEPAKWGEVLEAFRPNAVICALGTTWKKADEDEAAFRAVDEKLVRDVAQAARAHGVDRFVVVSSVGANAAAKPFYLRVKGEMEREVTRIRFPRLDILRPGLLLGERRDDRRFGERLGQMVAPVTNLFLHGKFRQYRAIPAQTVAQAALALARRPARGRFVHDNDAIVRAARSLPQIVQE